MTTDPRIAALAEALGRAQYGDDHFAMRDHCDSCTETAVLILAALPPDWCGHDYDMDTVTTHYASALELANAEMARLRPIEEAARDLIANTEVGAWPVSDALRAALEADSV